MLFLRWLSVQIMHHMHIAPAAVKLPCTHHDDVAIAGTCTIETCILHQCPRMAALHRADAEHVELVLAPANHSSLASPLSPANGTYFNLLKQAIQEHYSFECKPPDVLPFLLPGGGQGL